MNTVRNKHTNSIRMGGGILSGNKFSCALKRLTRPVGVISLSAIMVLTTIFSALPPVTAYAEAADQVDPPIISQHPSNSTYAKNADAKFYVRASSDGGYLTYQWKRSQAYPDNTANAILITLAKAGEITGTLNDMIKGTAKPFTTGSTDFGGNANADGTKATLTCRTPQDAGVNYYFYWVEVTNHQDLNNDGDASDPGETARLDSQMALTEVVDKSLSPELVLGNFEDKVRERNVGPINEFWPAANYPYRWNSTINEGHTSGAGARPTAATLAPNGVGKVFDVQPHTTWRGDWPAGANANHGSYSIEIAPFRSASAYQEIATVPGKIYEWSFDHANRYNIVGKLIDVMALIIGPAINKPEDYGKYVPGEKNYYNNIVSSDGAITTPVTTSNVQYFEEDGDYPYGVNNHSYNGPETDNTYFLAILDKMLNENGLTVDDLKNQPCTMESATGPLINQEYTVQYYGKDYYIYVASTHHSEAWQEKSGVYTVPQGQGTTVFGWLDITQHDGNIVDNIVFKSGTDVGADQDATFTGETKMSAPTRPGYAYALAEVRGSSVNELTALDAYYDPDGDGPIAESEINTVTNLGTGGWYTKYNSPTWNYNTPDGTDFAAGGVITFKNLIPGATYRIIGVPIGSINTGLGTNLGPAAVQDDGYYDDTKIEPAAPGGEESMPQISMEMYKNEAGQDKVRLSVLNTNQRVDYALLKEDMTAPVISGTGTEYDGARPPDTSGPATPLSGWTSGAPGTIKFEGLDVAATYYLVARPIGYIEITYADAAYGDDENLVAMRIDTPPASAEDVRPDVTTRTDKAGKSTISLAAARANQQYVVADVATGLFKSSIIAGDAAGLAFSNLNPAGTYQVLTRPTGGSWLAGVRVYPFADEFTIDFANNRVGLKQETNTGAIPADTAYRITNYPGTTDILGSASNWIPGTGQEYLRLDDTGLNAAGNGNPVNGNSVFDALDSRGLGSAKVLYRYSGQASYTGPQLRPEKSLVFPSRPAAPSAGGGDYSIDYPEEKLYIGDDLLESRPADDLSAAWTNRAASAELSFEEDLSWTGSAATHISLRRPVTSETFASKEADIVIAARPAPPAGVRVRLEDVDDPTKGIYIENLDEDSGYEYRWSEIDGNTGQVSGYSAWARMWPQDAPGFDSSPLMLFGDGREYDLRFPATATAPASFPVTVSTPLMIRPLTFENKGYREPTTAEGIEIINLIGTDVDVTTMTLTDGNTGSFAMTVPESDGDKTVAAGGSNTNYTLKPVENLNAGSYQVGIQAAYTHNGRSYTARATAYFTVTKANWDTSAILVDTPSAVVTSDSLSVTLSGVPEGATVQWQLGSLPPVDSDVVGADGKATFTDSGINPASTYALRYHLYGDANHNSTNWQTAGMFTTAYAAPDADAVIQIDYANETWNFRQGYSAANYEVAAVYKGDGAYGTGAGSVREELTGSGILSTYAGSGDFTIEVIRRDVMPPDPPVPASVAGTKELSGKSDAPTIGAGEGEVQTTRASTDTTNDGSIILKNTSFQYRSAGAGSWVPAYDSVTLMAGKYEVRTPPGMSNFASQSVAVTVTSSSVKVSLRTASYGEAPYELPTGISMPTGWVSDYETDQPGVFNHTKPSGAAIELPTVAQVVSSTHIFKGWYPGTSSPGGLTIHDPGIKDTPDFTANGGNPTAFTPAENAHWEYFAKWIVRPQVTSVLGAAPVKDNATAAAGLTKTIPVVLRISPEAGKTEVRLSDITLSNATSPAIYSDPEFTQAVQAGGALALTAGDTTSLYLVATSSDPGAEGNDDVYYRIDILATSLVTYSAIQLGGTDGHSPENPGVRTSTGMAITFSEPVTNLTANHIILTDATITGQAIGHADRTSITPIDDLDGDIGRTNTWYVRLANVQQGNVNLSVSDFPGYVVTGETTQTLPVYKDSTPPAATVNYKEKGFTSFLNKVTFGRFFKDTVSVTIGATDGTGAEAGDGIEKVEYRLSNAPIDEDNLPYLVEGWNAYAPFNIPANNKQILYVKVTDQANPANVTFYRDGIAVYTDAVMSGDIDYVRTTSRNGEVTAALGGNTIKSVVNTTIAGSDPLDLNQDYTVSDGKLTLTNAYLASLPAGSGGSAVSEPSSTALYTFVVTYNPLGESYSSGGGISEEPDSTGFTVTVRKHEQTQVGIDGLPSAPAFADPDSELTLTGGSGTGAVSFDVVKPDGTAFGEGEAPASVTGVTQASGEQAAKATLNIIKPGEFKVKAIKASDADYLTAELISETITVRKATADITGTGHISMVANETKDLDFGVTITGTGAEELQLTAEILEKTDTALGTGDPVIAAAISESAGVSGTQRANFTFDGNQLKNLPGGLYHIKVIAAGTSNVDPAEKIAGNLTVTDTNPPTGIINAGGFVYEDYSDSVHYKYFSKSAKIVSISATDGEAPSPDIYYLISEAPLTQQQAINLPDTAWTAGYENGGSDTGTTTAAAFSIPVGTKGFVYAKIVDASYNTTIINSDGYVVYTDASRPDTGSDPKAYTRASGDRVEIPVLLTGSAIADIVNEADGDRTLEAGTDYTVQADSGPGYDAKIVISNEYLQTLAADAMPYAFTARINPLGEPYVDGNENVEPDAVTFTVAVSKNYQHSLAINEPDRVTYGDGTYQLTVPDSGRANGGDGSGDLIFTKISGDDRVAAVSPSGLIAIRGAGTITVTALRAADDDYHASPASAPMTVTVEKRDVVPKVPAGLTATYGATLGQVDLSEFDTAEASATIDNPAGSWSFDASLSAVGAVGEQVHQATYTPADTVNYLKAQSALSVQVGRKELTVDVSIADKKYDSTFGAAPERPAALVGIIDDDLGGDHVTLVTTGVSYSFTNLAVGDDIPVSRTGDYSITGDRSMNYSLTQPGGQKANISPGFEAREGRLEADPGGSLIIGGTTYKVVDGEYATSPLHNGWTNTDFTIYPAEGFRIATENNANAFLGAGAGSLTYADETSDGSVTFYLRKVSGETPGIAINEISEPASVTYRIDKTLPTALIGYKGTGDHAFGGGSLSSGSADFSTVTFTKYYSAGATGVAIVFTGADNAGTLGTSSSGISRIEYVATKAAFANTEEARTAAENLNDWVDQSITPLEITAADAGKYHIFMRVTDIAGNSAVYLDNVVIFAESEFDSATGEDEPDATFERLSSGNATPAEGFRFNGNTVLRLSDVTDGEGDNATPLATAAWEADYGDGTITIKFTQAYLNTRPAGDYKIRVDYRPQGVAANLDESPGFVELPQPTYFTLRVTKANQNPLSVIGVNGSYTYGDAPVTIGTSGGSGGGAVSFESDAPQVASLSGPILTIHKAGTFSVRATKAADDTYWATSSAFTSQVTVNPRAPQVFIDSVVKETDTTISAHVSGVTGNIPQGLISFTVKGDPAFGPGMAEASTVPVASDGTAALVVPADKNFIGGGEFAVVAHYIPAAPSAGLDGSSAYYTEEDSNTYIFVSGRANRTPLTISGVGFENTDGQQIGSYTYGDPEDQITVGGGIGAVPSTGEFSLASSDPLVATVSPISAADGTFRLEIRKAGSFTLTARRAADANYNPATPLTTTTVTVAKATPSWTNSFRLDTSGDYNITGGGISYGQFVSDSVLTAALAADASPVVKGIGIQGGNEAIEGTFSWQQGIGGTVPGYDRASLSAIGEGPYQVTFTPSPAFAGNYHALSGYAVIPVSRATPVSANVAASSVVAGDKLSDSVITGDVSIAYAGGSQAVSGVWAWDTDADGDITEADTPGAITVAGTAAYKAIFTPDDLRVGLLKADVTVNVSTKKVVIVIAPMIRDITYGHTALGHEGIDDSDAVVILQESGQGDADLSGQGNWSWYDGSVRATSKTGSQVATVVFTPDDSILNPVYARVSFTVVKANPLVSEPAIMAGDTLLSVKSGDPLPGIPQTDETDDKWLGYDFSGIVSLDGSNLGGIFDWVSTVVGAADDEGNASADGYYLAKATFTPDAKYGSAYEAVSVYVPVYIGAGDDAVGALKEAAYGQGGTAENPAAGSALATLNVVKTPAAYENYDAADVAALEKALGDITKALAEDKITPNNASSLLQEVEAALSSLEHDHRLIEEKSALADITGTGKGAVAAFKGVFGGVHHVTISASGKQDITLGLTGTANPNVKELRLANKKVGTLTKGSAVVAFDATYLDTFENGSYLITAVFSHDGYKSGQGRAILKISRVPGNSGNQGNSGNSGNKGDQGDQGNKSNPGNSGTPNVKVKSIAISGIANNAKFSYKANKKGNTLKLSARVSPAGAKNQTVTWKSGNLGIASVDKTGRVTFKGPEGTVTITATANDGSGKVGLLKINVVKKVTKIRVPMTRLNLSVRKKIKIPVVVNDGKLLVKGSKLTYKSAKPSVATVDKKGNVKAGKKAGKTSVTITAKNGKKTKVTIVVMKKAVKLKKFTLKGIKKNALKLKKGKTKDLKIKLGPVKATNLKITFKSNKKKIATVDAAGRITALKKGKAVITVKVGKKTKKIKVTVK